MACFKSKYAEELVKNGAYIYGKSLFAADVGTEKKYYRGCIDCVFRDPQILPFYGGIILTEELLYGEIVEGKPITDHLKEKDVLVGISVDKGTVHLPGGTDGETTTQGLDGLGSRCAKYYEAGARFAKWRAVLKMGPNDEHPSELCIQENAYGLARFAAICQENGLVPILCPQILLDDGSPPHLVPIPCPPKILLDDGSSHHRCAAAIEKVLAACYRALSDHGVMLEGTVLKLVISGSDRDLMVEYADRAVNRNVPPAVLVKRC